MARKSVVFSTLKKIKTSKLIHKFAARTKLHSIAQSSRKLPLLKWVPKSPRAKLYAALIGLGAVVALHAIIFVLPRSINYSFGGDNCIFSPTLLPGNTVNAGGLVSINGRKLIAAAQRPLYSRDLCVQLQDIPSENSDYKLKLSALGIMRKPITVQVPALPQLTAVFDPQEKISITDQLDFKINQPDRTFSYQLKVGNKTSQCHGQVEIVSCPLQPLGLKQKATYRLMLERSLGSAKAQPVQTHKLTTLDPVVIKKSSIKAGESVISIPKQITLITNKKISSIDGVSLNNATQKKNLPIEASHDQTRIVVKLPKPLPRKHKFTLQIKDIKAEDGSLLAAGYKLAFTTSDGPRVTGVNIGPSRAPAGGPYYLFLDQEVDSKQSMAKFISLEANGKPVSATYTAYGRQLSISPHASFGRCITFTIRVAPGIKNVHGVISTAAWSYTSRTTCYGVFSIGTSVEGRGIIAYKFGDGAKTMVFVGGMHGDEYNTVNLLNNWVDELENNHGRIPKDKTIVIIPDSNPDGSARGSRTNARGVDLNRNFPTNDWQSETYGPGGSKLKNGGGKNPLSEPESSSLARYVSALSPRLVLTYHTYANAVIANGAGDSPALANIYGRQAGMSVRHTDGDDGFFDYPTTGEFEDWLYDKLGIPALLVELGYYTGGQFAAMWAMLGI